MSNIIFKNVHKAFGNSKVLQGLSLEVRDKQTHVVLGRSGCGKSVLLKCLLGIFKIDRGEITVDGISVSDETRSKEYIQKFSILFQGNALFDSMTIIENVEFGIKQVRYARRKNIRKIAEDTLASVGLERRVFDLYPAELSGGMQKRAALARAIAVEPEVLLFDEPTTGLDPITGGMICHLLKDTVKRLGITSLTITHDIKVAKFLSDEVSLINNGVIEWQGRASEMRLCGNTFAENFYKASSYVM